MKRRTKKRIASGVEAGLAVIAAAAVATYFLTGRRRGKTRRVLKGWAQRARREALAAVRTLRTVNRASYNRAIDGALRRYRRLSAVNAGELAALKSELISHWSRVSREVKRATTARRRT